MKTKITILILAFIIGLNCINYIQAQNRNRASSIDNPRSINDELIILSDKITIKGEKDKRVITYEGNVEIRFGKYRFKATKIKYVEETKTFVIG